MIIKGLIDEDFVNYKVPSMFIITSKCSFKCEKESGVKCCQNSSLAKKRGMAVENEDLIERYINNPITQAIVFGGLEPFDQFTDVIDIIATLRLTYNNDDDVVIYTGYIEEEVEKKIEALSIFDNIIVKFGRYIPGQESHLDEVLGVKLSSPNQYAVRL